MPGADSAARAAPAGDRSIATPAGADFDLVRSLSGNLQQIPVGSVSRARMCVVCGADQDTEPGGPCPSCGSAAVLLPPAAAWGPGPGIGSLHHRRAGLRKKWALVLGHGPVETTLLLHNGRTETVATADLPPAAEPPRMPALRSPIGRILVHAGNSASLPWTEEQLLGHAFALLGIMPWTNRVVALDLVELGRPDLLDRCGLTATEATWLGLVHAARRGDVTSVVAAAAALPADRYRRKITVLAALLEQVRRVPGAVEQLAPTLTAFADSEPLAAVLQRALGMAETSARQRIDDLTTLTGVFGAPTEIRQLLSGRDISLVDARARALLGPRGRLAALYAAAEAVPELGAVDLSEAPLAVLDDLIDAGKLTDLAAARAGRAARERTYITARLAPERLSDKQIDEVGHRDEAIRRSFLAGSTEVAGDDAERPLARHVAMVDVLARKRPQDLVVEHVLPAHRDVARRLADVIRAADEGADPATLLQQPLLADRTVWQPLARLFGTDRLRDASDELKHRCSDFFEWLSLTAAREHLFLADWRQAVDAARSCLDLATAEAIRDEAQNLVACGLHNLGDDTGALRELEQAIEGGYSVGLLANIGVVAARLDSELAARHLARIVREGPTVAMRMNAARQALAAWQSDSTKIWEGEGGEQRTLPTVLREPLRSIVTESIELDDFRVVVAAMARFDADWLRAPASLLASPHRETLEAKYHVALAANDMFMSAVDVLGTVHDWETAPAWLRDARDDLVRQTLDFLVEHIEDPDNLAGIIARALVEKVRGLRDRDRVLLALLAVATIAYHLTENDGEIAEGVIVLFEQYQVKARDLPPEDRKVADSLVELCVRRVTLNLAQARQTELAQLIDPYNLALDVLDRAPRGTAIWFQARRQVAVVLEACEQAQAQLRPWLGRLDDLDVRDMVKGFLESATDLEFKARRVLRS